jgi:hypothetical protein
MISPNLFAIWAFLFLNLSQDLIVLLLRYFGTLGDGNYCRAVTKSPRGTIVVMDLQCTRALNITKRWILKLQSDKFIKPIEIIKLKVLNLSNR